MLTIDGCRQRLERLRGVMSRLEIDLALITRPQNVYYFSGVLPTWMARSVLAVTDKESILVCGQEPEQAAASAVRTYSAHAIGTLRLDQSESVAVSLDDVFTGSRHVGTEFSTCEAWLHTKITGRAVDLDPELYRLRRRKDPDELALLRKSAACIDACYDYAREVIEPGLDEVELYGQLYNVAVEEAGEPIGRFGNDFQCGTPGGPPRKRAAQAGELWLLDTSVEYRGYAADTCRAFPVGGEVTDAQQEAWQQVAEALRHVEERVRPGVRCRDAYEEVKTRLDAFMPDAFFHHLGHGVGLFAHEAPHLNPHWDETFDEGDVFTAEPGVYHESLRGGIRLENDYLVTASGIERINHAPLELWP